MTTTQNEGDHLTPREREVVARAGRGLTNDQIAAELGITRNAVRYHLKEIHSKLETGGDRAGLAGRRQRGWLFGLGLSGSRAAAVLGLGGVGLALAAASVGVFLALPPGGDSPDAEVVDGRYPNGCPEVFNAGTRRLADFARGSHSTIEELQWLNPGLPANAPMAPETEVRVAYDPQVTCVEAQQTPANGAARGHGTPAAQEAVPTPR
ncbi:MAG: helix-turn-helix domain-containing protein [Tepidiformaceae bacterium]